MAAERSIKLRLEAEVSQYKRALDDAAQATERLAASQDLAAKKVDHAAAVQKSAAERVKAAEETLKKVRADSSSTAVQQSKAEQDLTKAKLDDTQASQTLRDAERGLTEAKLASAEATLKQETRMGRFEGFIEKNAAGVQAAGTIMVAFGGAITGVGLAAIKTGIEYNTLQQTTRKALTTLTGSAEAANAQMDKLDAFARTSPFSKGVFIQSQQQMLAFGIETEKVIPYLDALNDAVAASGGNSQTIGELTLIMSQISAASKITGTDLMQFAQRGVDAAGLIGSQLGMTGAQIREEITAGTLDATVALDALAAGMSETYAGAAAGVKDTFSGAIDRLKASWREFGALLAEPLVSQEGGGLLVDWANNAATLANNFRELPDPIRNTALALSGVVGVGSLVGGTFLLAAPRIIATRKALVELGGAAPWVGSTLKGVGVAAGIAGVALAAMYGLEQVNRRDIMVADVEEITARILDLADGAGTGVGALDEFFQVERSDAFFSATNRGLDGLGDALRKVTGIGLDSGEKFEKNFAWLPNVDDAGFRQATEGIEKLDSAMAQLVASGNGDQAAATWEELTAEAKGLGISTAELKKAFPGYTAALKDAENQARLNADATEDAALASKEHAEALQAQSDAADAAWDSMNKLTNGVLDARAAERDYLEAIYKATGALEDNGKTLDVNTVKGRANAEALDTIVEKGMKHVDALREQGASQEVLGERVKKVREDFIKQAEAFGASTDEAKALADQLNLFPGVVPTKVDVETAEGTQRTKDLERYVTEMGHSLDDWIIDGETGEAINKTNGLKYTIDHTTGTVGITAKTDAAKLMARIAQGYINRLNASINVTARINIAKASINTAVANAAASISRAIGGGAAGGRAGVGSGLPEFASGGRLPRTGLGTDQILGVNPMGQPTAWVDDREWIINRKSSDKYDGLLNAINQDSPALAGFAGGGSAGFAPVGVSANGGSQVFDGPINLTANLTFTNPISGEEIRQVMQGVAESTVRGNQRMVNAGARAGRR